MTLIEMLRANGSWEADAAVTAIKVRDMRIEKLEAALRDVIDNFFDGARICEIARKALEEKDE